VLFNHYGGGFGPDAERKPAALYQYSTAFISETLQVAAVGDSRPAKIEFYKLFQFANPLGNRRQTIPAQVKDVQPRKFPQHFRDLSQTGVPQVNLS
jgi:hypothetical protein